VNQENAKQTDGLIQNNRRITVRELAQIVGISVGDVETIIREELNFSNVSTRCVPDLLSDEGKEGRDRLSTQLLDRFNREDGYFCIDAVMCYET
jgi:hypothetical protein